MGSDVIQVWGCLMGTCCPQLSQHPNTLEGDSPLGELSWQPPNPAWS